MRSQYGRRTIFAVWHYEVSSLLVAVKERNRSAVMREVGNRGPAESGWPVCAFPDDRWTRWAASLYVDMWLYLLRSAFDDHDTCCYRFGDRLLDVAREFVAVSFLFGEHTQVLGPIAGGWGDAFFLRGVVFQWLPGPEWGVDDAWDLVRRFVHSAAPQQRRDGFRTRLERARRMGDADARERAFGALAQEIAPIVVAIQREIGDRLEGVTQDKVNRAHQRTVQQQRYRERRAHFTEQWKARVAARGGSVGPPERSSSGGAGSGTRMGKRAADEVGVRGGALSLKEEAADW